MTPEEQVTKNLDYAFTFLAAVLEDPSLLDRIPDGTNVMLFPAGDPELAEANQHVVDRATRRMRRRKRPDGAQEQHLVRDGLTAPTLLVNV